MIKYIKSQNLADCCGCRGCEQICAHKALTMQENEEGFLYPVLNKEACVDCGLCEKVCPLMHGKDLPYEEGLPIAAQNLNPQDLFTSSSGGAFVAIAKEILSDEGVVYGAAFDNGPTLCHQRITTTKGLESLKGSKYLQSDTRDVYQQVKKDLTSGKQVYFVGTPCQVAGLRLFLRKKYELLFTSDFVCHGTPSNKIFCNTVNHAGSKIGGKFKNYSFRDKNIKGWNCSSSSSWENGKKEIYKIYSKDMEAYFNAFISGDLMRMNCYSCPFARFERCSDITLADYWGVRVFNPEFPDIGKGVSLLLINSERGRTLFNEIHSQFCWQEIKKEHTVRNPNLYRPTPLNDNRNTSYQMAFNDYNAFVEKYYKGNYAVNCIKTHAEYMLRHSGPLFSLVSYLKRKLK